MCKKLMFLVLIVVMLGLVGNARAGIVTHYALDESSGSTATDDSGNGNDGTVSDNTWSVAGANGNTETAVHIGTGGDLTGYAPGVSGDFTLLLWINASYSEYNRVVNFGDAGNVLHFSDEGGSWELVFNSDEPIASGSGLHGGWQHLAFVVTGGSNVQIYSDGSSLWSGNVGSAVPIHEFHITHSPQHPEELAADIDDVAVFDEALDQDTITQLKDGGVKSNPTIEFESAASGELESVIAAAITVIVERGEAGQMYTVDYDVTGGTATGGGVDYTLAAGTLTFNPGQTSKTISIDIVNDGTDEDDETIEITLSNPTGADAALGEIVQHIYTIVDPRVSVGFAAKGSSSREDRSPANILVRLSGPASEAVTVDYEVSGGTATGGGVDYILADGTLTFEPGETTGYVSIIILDDEQDEVRETIELALSNPTGPVKPGGYSQHTFNIVDKNLSRLKGAYYCRLNSGESWEEVAKVGPHADVMVRFDDPNSNFVFRRASSYRPYWHSEAGAWYVSKEVETRYADGNDLRPDDICQYAQVFIIESSPARAVVRWRYAQDMRNADFKWDDFVDEYYTIYPNGVCIRTIRKGTENLVDWLDPANIIIRNLMLEFDGIGTLPASWMTVPDLLLAESSASDYDYEGFNQNQRCYLLKCKENGLPTTLGFTLDTTGGRSIHDPAIVVKNWGDADVAVTVDGRAFRNYYAGYSYRLEGSDLTVWLSKESMNPIDVSVSPKGGSEPMSRTPPGDPYARDVPIFPAGPADAGRFGAYYAGLKYEQEWDELWRVGEHVDVVVQFDQFPHRFVFWRGSSYIPCWVTDAIGGGWYTNEFLERRGSRGGCDGCAEPMSDKQCRHSHVRIIHSNDARVVVHWRYAPVDVHYCHPYVDHTGWGDWVDEYYTIYPDAVGVRKATIYTSEPDDWTEWQEAIVLNQPGTMPEDNLNLEAVSLANMNGESHTYSWEDDSPDDMDEPDNANIQTINLKGPTRPFQVINHNSAEVSCYEGSDSGSHFHWWDHWPVAQIKSDGNPASSAHRPSHTSLSHLRWQHYAADDGMIKSRTKIMLHGMSEKHVTELVPLAKSWEMPATLNIISSGFSGGSYDKSERAYKMLRSSEEAASLEFSLEGSEGSPIVNPCFIIENWWREGEAVLTIDGQTVEPGPAFRQGIEETADGISSLVVWIKKESTRPVSVTISKSSAIPGNLDQDRDVDMVDLGLLVLYWLDAGVGYQPLQADLNGDDRVNFADFAAFASHCGNCP